MEFSATRRPGKTHEKATRRVLVHDLFNHRAAVPEAAPQSRSITRTPPSLNSQVPYILNTNNEQATISAENSVPPLSASPVPQADLSDHSSTKGRKRQVEESKDVFDLSSSDNDVRTSLKEVQETKKRKVTVPRGRPASKPQVLVSQLQSSKPTVTTISNSGGDLGSSSARNHRQLLNGEKSSTAPNSRATSQNQLRVRSNTQRSRAPARRPLKHPGPVGSDESAAAQDDYASTDASGHLTDYSVQSTHSVSGASKRKRALSARSDFSVSSPSSLGFTSLRLTPDRKPPFKKMQSPDLTSDEETPRKFRSRLIDRLDAPTQNGHQSPEHDDQKPFESALAAEVESVDHIKFGSNNPNNTTLRTRALVETTALESAQNLQHRTTYTTKARTTYAKERSHLSDMVIGLGDDGDLGSSQPSEAIAFLQPSSSNLAMQLELEDDDSDDDAGRTRLKSIHELRKAGANNRFDREIQGFLEDINAKGDPSKALRIQALIKLIKRLEDSRFLRHFIDREHVRRLYTQESSALDIPSSTLMTIVLMMVTIDANSTLIDQLTSTAVILAPALLATDRIFTKVISDRKENLSKSTIRDVTDIVKALKTHEMFPENHDTDLYPNELALQYLNQIVRRNLSTGTSAPKISLKCYTAILDLLHRYAKTPLNATDSLHGLQVITTALQCLEACSLAVEESGFKGTDQQCEVLGADLAKFMSFSDGDNQKLNQDVLRVVVSLSNNKPHICRTLGQSPVLDSIFAVIDNHFQTVASQVEAQQQLDHEKLDSVILALGCLLNLAECDGTTRTKLSHSHEKGSRYTERLVSIFNSQVTKMQDATTTEQSQVLVAFGYLSMLLCTISLNSVARSRITQLLHKQSFAELCTAAETFFSHLQTLEDMSGEDPATSAFTARFSAILDTIKDPATHPSP